MEIKLLTGFQLFLKSPLHGLLEGGVNELAGGDFYAGSEAASTVYKFNHELKIEEVKKITEKAKNFTWNKLKDHKGEIGSNHPNASSSGKEQVHCTTYAVDAIAEGYREVGLNNIANEIVGMRNESSVDIAKRLVELGWEAVYFNPNTKDVSSGGEHSYSNHLVDKKGTYYDVKVSEKMTNFNTDSNMSAESYKQFQKMQNIDFGLVVAKGGTHSAIFANNGIYEVHYNEDSSANGTDNLYEKSDIKDFTQTWGSGLIVVPPQTLNPTKTN